MWNVFKLSLKKNLTIKARDKKATLLEILLPLFMGVYLVFLRATMGITESDAVVDYPTTNVQSVYNLAYELNVMDQYLLYTPSDNPAMACVVAAQTERVQARFLGFDSEDELNAYYGDVNDSTVFASVIFAPESETDFTIRMDGSTLPSTTGSAFSSLYPSTYSNQQYLTSGFLTVQLTVYRGLLSVDDSIGNNATECAQALQEQWNLNVREEPTPSYRTDTFVSYMSGIGTFFMIVGFAPYTAKLLTVLVKEKEERLREGQKIMGISGTTINLAWWATYSIVSILPVIITSFLLSDLLFQTVSFWLVFWTMFVFVQTLICAAFIFAPFFDKFKTASTVASLTVMTMYLPYYLADRNEPATYQWISLSSPAAFAFAFETFTDANAEGVEMNLSNLIGASNTTFAFWQCFVMLWLDLLLYYVLAWYLEHVVSGDFGVSKPFYFCLRPSYWTGADELYMPEEDEDDEPNLDVALLQNSQSRLTYACEPVSDLVAQSLSISIQGMTKKFVKKGDSGDTDVKHLNVDADGRIVALDDVSLDLYDGQILALLGHNGAGKSTLISMLTGLFRPTSGRATVYGKDLIKDLDRIRNDIGVCPQHDVLFQFFSVREHLEFYGTLKGIAKEELEPTIIKWLKELQLLEKIDSIATDLSGGQKRKLCIIISMIGNSRVVYLDEPTSGMDPYSRRLVWKLLQREKKHRTIILTTHFMDEADLLGDRVAILNNGKLSCIGSSLFLKSRFGVGYRLDLVANTSENVEKMPLDLERLIQEVQRFVPNAQKQDNASDELITFTLPLPAVPEFPGLFNYLDANLDNLGISSYGVCLTTLEDVFLRLANDNEHQIALQQEADRQLKDKELGYDDAAASQEEKQGPETAVVIDKETLTSTTTSGLMLQLKGMLRKRYNLTRRNKRAMFFSFVFPLVYSSISLVLYSSSLFDDLSGTVDTTPLTFPHSSYSHSEFPYAAADAETNDWSQQLFNSSTDDEFDTFALDASMSSAGLMATELLEYSQNSEDGSLAALFTHDVTEDEMTMTLFFNSSATHIMPSSLQYIARLLLAQNDKNSYNATTLTDHPYPSTNGFDMSFIAGMLAAMLIGIGFSSIPSVFGINLVLERECSAVHVQRVMGVRIGAFHGANLIFDLGCFMCTSLGLYIICAILDVEFVFYQNTFPALLLFLFFGMGATLLMYCLSYMFDSALTATSVLVGGSTLIPMVFFMVTYAITDPVILQAYVCVMALLPHAGFMYGLNQLAYFDMQRQGCAGDLCPLPTTADVLGWENGGMAGLFLSMMVAIVMYALILTHLESKNTSAKFCCLGKKESQYVLFDTPRHELEDNDVEDEKQKLRAAYRQNPEQTEAVQMMNLRKVYEQEKGDPKIAVGALTLGIQKGDFFGLLGPNGAGKTTTIKMITGATGITSGDCFVNNMSCVSDMDDIYSQFGFCPQFDGLFDRMTGREHMEMYAAIKGLSPAAERAIIAYYAEALKFTEHLDKLSSTYSGGTKRKLCLSIALLGRPDVVMLDEPSTGMDPFARRGMWDLLSDKRERQDRVFLLTTHSMEEADALCNRIGIMVNGRLRCLGSGQHLKSAYGDGYRVEVALVNDSKELSDKMMTFMLGLAGDVKLNSTISLSETKLSETKTAVTSSNGNTPTESLEPIRLIENFAGRMRFEISRELELKLGFLFKEFEAVKRDIGITDYSISQTSLDQVFVHFAKEQDEQDE